MQIVLVLLVGVGIAFLGIGIALFWLRTRQQTALPHVEGGDQLAHVSYIYSVSTAESKDSGLIV